MTGREWLWLVVNGKQTGNHELRDAVEAIRGEGAEVTVRVTWETGDAERWAAEGARKGADVVVACGGDGTLGEVVRGVLDAGGDTPPVGMVPLGTANDFATAAGLVPGGCRDALRLAREGRASRVDLGRLGDDLFVNGVTAGFAATITPEASDASKEVLGGLAYYLQSLLKVGQLSPTPVRVRTEDLDHEGDVWSVVVANGRLIGPGVEVAPEALLDDGALDLLIVPADEPGSLRRAAAELAGLGSDAAPEPVIRARSSWVELERRDGSELQVTIDGEPASIAGGRVEAVPAAVPMVLPDGCPLLGR